MRGLGFSVSAAPVHLVRASGLDLVGLDRAFLAGLVDPAVRPVGQTSGLGRDCFLGSA